MRTSDEALLVEDLVVRYGPIVAVDGVSLEVPARSLVAVLGANGAGKSSLLRGISAVVRPYAGTVRLNGRELRRQNAYTTARAGIAHVPEGRRVIAPLTVEENLLLAATAARRHDRKGLQDTLEEIYGIFPTLHERRMQQSGLLSGGEQQMLAIGRGLAARPDVLLLDEPSMGLAPIVIDAIYDLLRERPGTMRDCGILLAEQSAALAMDVADHVYLLVRGKITAHGPPSEISNAAVTNAYLGAS